MAPMTTRFDAPHDVGTIAEEPDFLEHGGFVFFRDVRFEDYDHIAFTFWTVWLGVWLDFLDDRYGAASGAFFIAFCRKNSAKRSSRGETKRPRPFISDNCVSAFCHQSPELPSPFFSKASAIFQ
jgi:hypothetical protein